MLDGTGGGIEIGNHCDISAGVQIYTHDSIERCITESKAIKKSAVKIGNNCYIAPQCIISKGVSIGNQCIIAGTPAKQIGEVNIDSNGNVEFIYFKKEDR